MLSKDVLLIHGYGVFAGLLFFGLFLLWEFWLIHSCCESLWITASEGVGPR